MSNSNDDQQNSSNVTSTSETSSSVESSNNGQTTNIGNNNINKASAKPFISKLCENPLKFLVNQAKALTGNEATDLSTNENAGASSSTPTENDENAINYSTAENNTNLPSISVNQNLKNQTGLSLQTSSANQLNTTNEQNFQVRFSNSSSDLENETNSVNTTASETVNICIPHTSAINESQSEYQITTSIYLTNNPSGLPHQPPLTNRRKTDHVCRQDHIPTAPTTSSQLYYNPPESTRNFLNVTESTSNAGPVQNVASSVIPSNDTELNVQPESNVEVSITPLPMTPCVIQGPPPIAGAPPTYSAIMRLGPDDPCVWTHSIRIQPSPPFIAPIPPPPYTEIQGIHSDRPILVASADQMIWGPDPISVVCPRCGNVVVTATESQRSNLSHFSALALFLCFCWPCCLLPYCMDSCKNTYHHCPTCQQFLGMYRPW